MLDMKTVLKLYETVPGRALFFADELKVSISGDIA